MMRGSDPSKRIPKSIGTDAKLLGTYTLSDLAVALLPGVLIVLITRVFLPPSLTIGPYSIQTLTLPLAATAIIIGGVCVYLTPAYTSSINWLATYTKFLRTPNRFDHEAAKQCTHIERIHPNQGCLERVDGALIGMVHVESPSMALATDNEWREKATAFQDFCNTTIEFPIQIYSTTHEFPVDDYLGHYESRLTDPDVKVNPRLASLIEQYIEWYRKDLTERRMTIRDHYVIIPVHPDEVVFEHASLLQQLTHPPLIGLIVESLFAPRTEERKAAMVAALDERLQRVESGIRSIDGCTAQRTEPELATRVLAEFWAGQPLKRDNMNHTIRTRPLVSNT